MIKIVILVVTKKKLKILKLLSLKKKMLVIPTPGQTEQEYLALRLMESHICFSTTQDKLICSKDFASAKVFPYQFPVFPLFNEAAIDNLLHNIDKRFTPDIF